MDINGSSSVNKIVQIMIYLEHHYLSIIYSIHYTRLLNQGQRNGKQNHTKVCNQLPNVSNKKIMAVNYLSKYH